MALDTLLLAALAALVAATVLAGGVMAVDRLLPARLVRERHDLALAALIVIPLVFFLALRAAPDLSADVQAGVAGFSSAQSAEATSHAARPTTSTGPVLALTAPETVWSGVWPVLGRVLLLVWLTGCGRRRARWRVRRACDCLPTFRLQSALP